MSDPTSDRHLPTRLPHGTEFLELLVCLDRAAASQRLLGGLAHEIGNIQQALHFGRVNAAALEDPSGSNSASDWISRRLDAAIVALRSFATPTPAAAPSDPGPVLLGDVATGVLELQRYQKNLPPIPIQLDVAAALPAVQACEPSLRQALLGLVTNAKEALRDVADGRIALVAQAVEDGVQLLVEDTGPGIPPERRQEVFEAFYTTKSRAAHAGIGLTVCRHLVGRVGGTVAVDGRADGPGTRVVVHLQQWRTPARS